MLNDEQVLKERIAKSVKQFRGEKNLSSRQLAERSGIDEKMIRRIESGDYFFAPSLSILIKVANALEVNIVKLL